MKRNKRISIKNFSGWGSLIFVAKENIDKIGLQYVEDTGGILYDVIDEPLFMLSVIKHGIIFENEKYYKQNWGVRDKNSLNEDY